MWNIYSFYQSASKFLSFKIKLVMKYYLLKIFWANFEKKNPWNLLELFGMDRIKNLMKKWGDETSI